MLALFYEKRIRSFDKLMREIGHLDFDSGVRIAGSYHERGCFAFITRSANMHTVMVYEREGRKAPLVGAKILSREFRSVDKLGKFLGQIAQNGVDAYVY